MAKKRDHAVVAVISDLTPKQASRITKEISDITHEVAPQSRSIAFGGLKEAIGKYIQTGRDLTGIDTRG